MWLRRDCWCTGNSPAVAGLFSFISGRMCLQCSHSPGEHLFIRLQWILIPVQIVMITAVHRPQQLWSGAFFLNLLSFKNFHESFQRFGTGPLASVTVVISAACWVILFRLQPLHHLQIKADVVFAETDNPVLKKMIIYSRSFSSHYAFLHLFPL